MPKYYDIKASAKGEADLWLYGFIGNSVWDEINPKALLDELKELGTLQTLRVHINSGGGSVYGGNAIYNALKMNQAEVHVYIEGLAASMASVIAMAGDQVFIADNALMMIHDPWTWADGNAAELRKIAEQLDKAKDTLIASYVKKTGLDSEYIANMMSEESWFTAAEAVEFGFADETIESIDLAASIKGMEFGAFKNAPEQLKQLLNTNQSEKADAIKEGETMPSKVKASEEQTDNKPDVNVDEIKAKAAEEAKAEALKAEQSRRAEVKAVFEPFGSDHAELKTECLDDMEVNAEVAREKLLAAISKKPASPAGYNVVIEDSRDKMRAGFVAAIMAKSGQAKDDTRNEFRGYSLLEMARYSLEKSGVNTRNMDRMEMVGAAFTHSTSDFPNILKDVAHKSMLKGWDEAPETFQLWTSTGILTDFREASRVGLNSFPDLDVIPSEGGEYKYGTVGDRGETIQLATYGKLVGLTRQAIINDDLSAFSRLPSAAGRAARRTIGNLVYAILTGNPLMADGVALFAAGHNNIGTGGVPTTASIDELRQKMALQTDGNANALGISPAFLIVPEALRGKCIAIIESETEMAASQNNSRRPNYVRNIADVISDARLDADSSVKYYMAANPAMHDTIEVAYLDGVQEPYLEQKAGWTVDGVEMKVRIDAGVKALDHRTMAYNAGA